VCPHVHHHHHHRHTRPPITHATPYAYMYQACVHPQSFASLLLPQCSAHFYNIRTGCSLPCLCVPLTHHCCTHGRSCILQADHITTLLAAMLCERKIIVCSDRVELLAPCAELLVALLFPFRWQCLYVPVMPANIAGECVQVRPGCSARGVCVCVCESMERGGVVGGPQVISPCSPHPKRRCWWVVCEHTCSSCPLHAAAGPSTFLVRHSSRGPA
jgi:hypothetical protein